MALRKPASQDVAYDEDVVTWAQTQARHLRERKFSALDVEAVADEIEDVGRSEKRELARRTAVLLAHLLKHNLQPAKRSRSWVTTIRDQRRRTALLLKESPSLRSPCFGNADWREGVWLDARILAQREMKIPSDALPAQEIWTLDAICDQDFLPD